MGRQFPLLAIAAALATVWAGHAIGGDADTLTKGPGLRQATRLLDTWIESVLDYERLPGLSIAVVHDQEVVHARGYGHRDVDKELEATTGTIYSICSISKMFTAIAVMQLRDAGRLELDAPVSRYLPWFAPEGETADRPVTIRDLLRHSGGLPCEVDHAVRDDPTQLYPDRDELIARAGRLRLSFPVDTRFNYSNLGYSLLGEVVSAVSGRSYEEYVQQRILDPLGMDDTILFPPGPATASRMATGYSHQPRRPGPRPALTDREPGAFAPAGGYYSTVLDMAEFARWQFRVLDGRDDRILGRETLEEMRTEQWPGPKWGLGFTLYWIGDLDLYGHQGGCSGSGFKAQFVLCPEEKTAVVVMINASDAPQFMLAFSAYELMSAALKEGGESGDEPNAWSRFAGYYASDRSWSDAEVLEWDGSLAVLWVPAQNPLNSLVRLRHVEGGIFRQIDDEGNPGKHYAFEADAAGNVRMRFNSNVLRRTAR